jgi:hypothetical protein
MQTYLKLDLNHLKLLVLSKSYFAFLLLSEAAVLFGLIKLDGFMPAAGLMEVLVALPLLLDSDSDIIASKSGSFETFSSP